MIEFVVYDLHLIRDHLQVQELVKKAQQLEVELDKTKEELMTTTQKLEEKEKALLASELEVRNHSRVDIHKSSNTDLYLALLAGVLPQQTGPEFGGGPGDLRGQAAARHTEARQGK